MDRIWTTHDEDDGFKIGSASEYSVISNQRMELIVYEKTLTFW